MSAEFQECLRKRKITLFTRGKTLAAKECQVAQEDYKTAQASFAQKRYKWATIQAYYSMFHSARALLYAKKYREKSHVCLITAVRHLYVETKIIPLRLLESLQQAKMLRENADYSNEWSRDGAEILLKAAKELQLKTQKIITPKK